MDGSPTGSPDEGDEQRESEAGTRLVRVEGAQLDRELVVAWVAIAHEFFGPCVEVLLADLDALAELRWLRISWLLAAICQSCVECLDIAVVAGF